MEIVVLGSGSPLPDPQRAGPSTLVSSGGDHLLVDTGRGVLMRLAGAGVVPGQLGAVLLTHLHSDHTTDLNDVITTHWVMSFAPSTLRVIGPAGTNEHVQAVLAMLRTDVGFRRAHHDDLHWEPQVEVTEVADGDEVRLGSLTVQVSATDHRPVEPSVAYRIADAQGHAAVVAGDTVPCAGLDALCAGAGALVQTAIRTDVLANLPLQRLKDVCDYHSSVEDAAGTAQRAGIATLVLTHLLPAPADEAAEQAFAALATGTGFDGEVVVARDLVRVPVAAVPGAEQA